MSFVYLADPRRVGRGSQFESDAGNILPDQLVDDCFAELARLTRWWGNMAFKVLVVDDSKLARMAVAKALGGLRPDWTRVEAANADEALAALQEQSPTSRCWTSICREETDWTSPRNFAKCAPPCRSR